MNRIIRSIGQFETEVHTATSVETGNLLTNNTVHAGERAAEEHLAVGLHRDGFEARGDASAGIKTGVERSIGVQARDLVLRSATDAGEGTTDDDLAIGLQSQADNEAVGTDPWIQGRVHIPRIGGQTSGGQ